MKTAHYAQLGLRLLGVMFFVDGAASMAGNLAYGASVASVEQHSDLIQYLQYVVVSWPSGLATSAVYMATGLYCMIGGRWLLEMVFLPASVYYSGSKDEETSAEDE